MRKLAQRCNTAPRLENWSTRHARRHDVLLSPRPDRLERRRALQGHADIPLNATGLAQAEALVEVLRPLELDLIVTSDLKRAAKTAEVAATALDIPMESTEALREIHMGGVQGLTFPEVLEAHGSEMLALWDSVPETPAELDLVMSDGESRRQLIARVRAEMARLTTLDARRIGVSVHGGVIRQVLGTLFGAHAEELRRVPNVAVYEVRWEADGARWIFGGLVEAGGPITLIS